MKSEWSPGTIIWALWAHAGAALCNVILQKHHERPGEEVLGVFPRALDWKAFIYLLIWGAAAISLTATGCGGACPGGVSGGRVQESVQHTGLFSDYLS